MDVEDEMFDVHLGQAVPFQTRLVALWWDAHSIPERDNVDFSSELAGVPEGSGVYAVTGRHEGGSGPGVLYIGQARDLATRMPTSAYESLSEVHANGQRLLCSDVWDLTVRWARLSADLLEGVERLLIMSHSPPFNSQGVRRGEPRSEEYDLVVMNGTERAGVSHCGGRVSGVVEKPKPSNCSVSAGSRCSPAR
jgi:hypothetical protein